MSEIKGFDLSRLTQDENFGFHSFAIVEFEKCKDSKITEFVNNYKVKYNVFDGSMKVSGGENVLSYDVTRLDKVRDDAYRGLKRQNNVAMNDFDPVIARSPAKSISSCAATAIPAHCLTWLKTVL